MTINRIKHLVEKLIGEDYYQDKEVRRIAREVYTKIMQPLYSHNRLKDDWEVVGDSLKIDTEDELGNKIKVYFAPRKKMAGTYGYKVNDESSIYLNAFEGDKHGFVSDSLKKDVVSKLRENKDFYWNTFLHEYQHLYSEVLNYNDVSKVHAGYISHAEDPQGYREQGIEHVASYQELLSSVEDSLHKRGYDERLEILKDPDQFISVVNTASKIYSSSEGDQRKKLNKLLYDFRINELKETENRLNNPIIFRDMIVKSMKGTSPETIEMHSARYGGLLNMVGHWVRVNGEDSQLYLAVLDMNSSLYNKERRVELKKIMLELYPTLSNLIEKQLLVY